MAEVKTEKKIVMAWSECTVEIGQTGESNAMALEVASVGKTKDKSSTLEATDGEKMVMKASGGKSVAEEETEGDFVFKTRIIEPDDELYTKLGLGAVALSKYNVKTHIVAGDWSLKVTPKNTGATGIEAPKTHIKFHPGWDEDGGHYADVEFTILQATADIWYTRFKKA